MKICSKCRGEKELDDFYKKKDSKDGRRGQCKVCVDAANAVWAQENPAAAKAIRERYFAAHPGAKARAAKKFNDAHPESQREYQRRKYTEDPRVRLARRLRGRVRNALKAGSAVADLGCTISELKARFETMFYPHPITGEAMTWENHGPDGWHIDHRRPLADFDLTDRTQFLQAAHFTNLQPLWAVQNWNKGATVGAVHGISVASV